MRDKKIIAYKSECAKKIAYNFRKLLTKVVMQEWERLGDIKYEKIKAQQDRTELGNERSSLYRALDASICICPGCNQTGRDMVYNAYLEEWYCTACVQRYRDFYSKKKAILDKGGFIGDFDAKFHKSFL